MEDFGRITRNSTGWRRSARRRRWVGILAVVVVLLLGLGLRFDPSYLYSKLASNQLSSRSPSQVLAPGKGQVGQVKNTEQLASKVPATSSEPVNVLILGVDTRPKSEQDEVPGSRTDTIMLAQVTPDTGNIELLSIPRDLMVEVEPGVKDRINSAYAYGGVDQTIKVVGDYTGLPIHHYVVVDFKGFQQVVNAMGGVQIDLKKGQYPPGWQMKPGVQTLKGHRALVYSRWRGTDGGDLDRIQRQHQMVAALRSEAFDWSNVTKLPKIDDAINKNVQTDMGPSEMMSFAKVLMKQGRSAQMTATSLKGTPKTLSDGREVLEPKDKKNEDILQKFRY